MADLLTRVQRELDERMAALRPLVEEAHQLEQALEALNGAPSHTPAPAVSTPTPMPRPTRPRPTATPAEEPAADDTKTVRSRISREQADQRRKQALAIITENPGTTASNLALLLDTSTGTMHSLLKRLELEGEIEKAEKGYSRPKATAS
jgi:predicted Rossmann fold nucleotide-binding protein DprA/Smf involved in DNA uptake